MRKSSGNITSLSNKTNIQLELELYKKILHIFQIGEYYHYTTNQNNEISFMHPDAVKVLGHQPGFNQEFFFKCIHPQDTEHIIRFKDQITNFRQQLSVKKVLKYKVQYNFRLKKANGAYIHILHQEIPIEITDDGTITQLLNLDTDISYLEPHTMPTLSFIGLENQPSFLEISQDKSLEASKSILSNVEKEILKLMMQGNSSLEISKILYRSKFTIDTHRKNMLIKTQSATTAALINKALKENWI
ncbi:MAG: LuxR family transcriptional regulator [Flavobacterium sp.]|nr:MAG: LuxR family transcriptional regulator [Flavobacterium sp.]